jgi:PPOX class probable F420-dependent enzyme
MAAKPGPGTATGYFAPLSGAKYMQLTTFRRDGSPVATPVHVITDGGTAFFRTWDTTGKAKRLRHTPAVRVAPATVRGRPLGPPIPAEAHGWTTQQYRLERPARFAP